MLLLLYLSCVNVAEDRRSKGNQLQLLTDSDDVMQALIRDIQLARHNIEMVFYIWQPGGMADKVAESLMAAARRGIHCRLMLDSAGSVAFSVAHGQP